MQDDLIIFSNEGLGKIEAWYNSENKYVYFTIIGEIEKNNYINAIKHFFYNGYDAVGLLIDIRKWENNFALSPNEHLQLKKKYNIPNKVAVISKTAKMHTLKSIIDLMSKQYNKMSGGEMNMYPTVEEAEKALTN